MKRGEAVTKYATKKLGTRAAKSAVAALDDTFFACEDAVLDVGCGDGKLTAELAEQHTHCAFKGIDISPAMIGYANQHHGSSISNLSFEVGDATTLASVDSNSVDKLVSVSATHWVHSQRDLWESFSRVLKPGGRMYVSTYPYNEVEYLPVKMAIENSSDEKIKGVFSKYESESFPLSNPLGHLLSDAELVQLLEHQLHFRDVMVTRKRREYMLFQGSSEYTKLLEPWHPWLLHALDQTSDEVGAKFLADVRSMYEKYTGYFNCDKTPFHFDVLEISATKPHGDRDSIEMSQSSSYSTPSQFIDRADTRPKNALFASVSKTFSHDHFEETNGRAHLPLPYPYPTLHPYPHPYTPSPPLPLPNPIPAYIVDFANPQHLKDMDIISAPLREVSQTDMRNAGMTFHSHGWDIVDVPSSTTSALDRARKLGMQPRECRSFEDVHYMEDNIGVNKENGAIEKGHGAARIFQSLVQDWARATFSLDDPVVVPSDSVKIRHAFSRPQNEGILLDDTTDATEIAPQPHVHIDYWDYDAAVRRLHHPPEWPCNHACINNDTPDMELLVEAVNVWLPLNAEPIQDWGFGFVVGGAPEYIPVLLNGARWSANVRFCVISAFFLSIIK